MRPDRWLVLAHLPEHERDRFFGRVHRATRAARALGAIVQKLSVMSARTSAQSVDFSRTNPAMFGHHPGRKYGAWAKLCTFNSASGERNVMTTAGPSVPDTFA